MPKRAFEVIVRIRLNPNIIGPDADTGWNTDASATDYISEIFAEKAGAFIDWHYVGWSEPGDSVCDIVEHVEPYSEGDMLPNDDRRREKYESISR